MDATLHRPKVAHVRNRKYVEGTMSLDRGQRGTMDVDYRTPRAAEVLSPDSMVYRLTSTRRTSSSPRPSTCT